MSSITISSVNLLLVCLLLLVPVAIFYGYGIGLVKKTLWAAVRMCVQLLMVGLYLKVIFDLDSPWLNVAWVLVMIVIANLTVLRNAGLRVRRFFWPAGIGIAFSTLFSGCALLALAVKPQPFYQAQYFIPILGMILGNCMRGNVLSLERFYSAIRSRNEEFQCRLFLGASLGEACAPYFREAVQAALSPLVSTMATIGLVSLPGMMTGQILGGAVPMTAVKYQIAIMVAIFVASTLSAVINIRLSMKVAFNHYHLLRDDIFTADH